MVTTVRGVVKDGLVVPNAPLPEGAQVEIRLCGQPPAVSPELQAEFDGWERASSEALNEVERLAQEILQLAHDPQRLSRMAEASRGLAHRDAAKRVVDLAMKIIKAGNRK